MQRSKKSILNAIFAAAQMLVHGLLSMVVTKLILTHYGSDFNGINSAATQMVNMLLLLEGGFTIATNVALFKPYSDRDYKEVNRILVATRNTFRKIGLAFLSIGILTATGYSLIVNSQLSFELIFTTMIMAILPSVVNLYFVTKYRILIQAEQKEYVISFFTLMALALGDITNIITISLGGPMWTIRAAIMVFSIMSSFCIATYAKRHYTFIDYSETPNTEAIRGTGDILVQKIANVLYNTIPILFISITDSTGTVAASIYAVYNNVLVLIRNLMTAIMDAPRLALGDISAQNDPKRLWRVFQQYQLVVFLILFLFISVTAVLIMPFVIIYTEGVADANYLDPVIAALMVVSTMFNLLHLPSRHLITMSGEFRVVRNINLIGSGILVVSLALGTLFGGLHGILIGVLVTAIFLAVAEIGYVHCKFLPGTLPAFFRLTMPLLLISLALFFVEIAILPPITGFIKFGICGVVLVVINGIVLLAGSYLFNREITVSSVKKCLSVVLRKFR